MAYYGNQYAPNPYGYSANLRPEAPTPMAHEVPRSGYGGGSYARSDPYQSPTIYNSGPYGGTYPSAAERSYPERPATYAPRTNVSESNNGSTSQWQGSAVRDIPTGYSQYRADAATTNARQPVNTFGRRDDVFSPAAERPMPHQPIADSRPESRSAMSGERSESRSGPAASPLVGVGIVFQQYDDGNMYIKSLVPCEAATLANPRPNEGDCIIGVDDKEVLGCDLAYLRSLIMGRPSTAVILRLRRPSGATYTTIIIRGARADPSSSDHPPQPQQTQPPDPSMRRMPSVDAYAQPEGYRPSRSDALPSPAASMYDMAGPAPYPAASAAAAAAAAASAVRSRQERQERTPTPTMPGPAGHLRGGQAGEATGLGRYPDYAAKPSDDRTYPAPGEPRPSAAGWAPAWQRDNGALPAVAAPGGRAATPRGAEEAARNPHLRSRSADIMSRNEEPARTEPPVYRRPASSLATAMQRLQDELDGCTAGRYPAPTAGAGLPSLPESASRGAADDRSGYRGGGGEDRSGYPNSLYSRPAPSNNNPSPAPSPRRYDYAAGQGLAAAPPAGMREQPTAHYGGGRPYQYPNYSGYN